MRSPRYTILLANQRTGTVRRFTVARAPVILAILSLLTIPALIGLGGLGARRSGQAEIEGLRLANENLRLENESYRAATGELATQISSLQSAMTELNQVANLDPAFASEAAVSSPTQLA